MMTIFFQGYPWWHGTGFVDSRGRQRLGFEVKRTNAPRVTPSMRHAFKDLKLKRLDALHAGEETFPLGEKIRAGGFSPISTVLEPL